MKPESLKDDDIVISGIGCKLSEADDLSELAEKLFGEKDLIGEKNKNGADGKIEGVYKFDNTFFGVSNIVARSMDPMTRHILERSFEAVIDAGINPTDIKGTNGCVFSGSSFSEFDLIWQADSKGGYGIMGRNRCMNANRVSYWLDLKGTSVSYDANYVNGILNLVNGWEAIRNGSCDTALVSTANFHSVSETSKQLNDFKKLSPDGICKSYDDSADGWNRGDAVVVFVIQRAKVAKRCYAVIEHAMSKIYGDREDILQKPSQQYWEMMLKEFYAQSKINSNDIFYVEGNGAGIKEEDAEELNALTSVFCKNRTTPLLVGSVKSNLGHTEAASASCGILKAIISLEKGIIPKNLHYNSPNSSSPGLVNKKIQVVDKNVPIPPNGLIAVNATSIAGMYGHVVLRANPKTKNHEYDGIPRLVPLSARQDEFIDELFDKIEAETLDTEQIGLLQDIFSKSMDRYLSRGYTILPKINDVSLREHQVFDPIKRPVWFIFSGMGSQWTEMGKRLMDLPLFRESIEKSHEVLKKKGLDLIEIITTDDPKVFDNVLHSFVGIAAMQIAFVDILNALGIVPDKMIGHSVGELGCSYADGCLTAEQTILCAYSRGKASIETPLTKGFMAAIGKGYNEIKDELPEGIEVACRNAADSCTISGPAELVQNYVKELTDRKVFARTVNVSNIAYHSQYIKPAAPKLLAYLKNVILEPKLRSKKWVSTSNLEENWDTDLAKYCSAEYHTNNLLSSVYFEEGSRKIPINAICIEIAPHGLLQAILKRSLGKDCVNIPITNRTAKDPLIFFLQALGKMYTIGLEPKITALYPKIEYPVARSTGSLHQFVRWQHKHALAVYQYISEKRVIYSLKDLLSKTSKDGIGYLIDEKNYYPLSVFIVLIWKIFATSLKRKLEECPVIFENIRAENPVPVHISEKDDVFICIGTGTGQFEIFKDHVIAKGTVSLADDIIIKFSEETIKNQAVSKTDIYEQFDRENYIVGNDFKNLSSLEITENFQRGKIPLASDWLKILESMIQLRISSETHSLLFPLSLEKLRISPKLHSTYTNTVNGSKSMVVELNKWQNMVKCGGIEMKGLQLQSLPKLSSKLKFQSNQFVPFINPPLKSLWRFVDHCFGIVMDNCKGLEINILEVTNGVQIPSIASYLEEYFSYKNIKIAKIGCKKVNNIQRKHDLVVSSTLEDVIPLIDESGFIFAIHTKKRIQTAITGLEIITKYSLKQDDFVLYKKREILTDTDYVIVPENEAMLHNIIKGLNNKSNKITYLICFNKVEEKMQKQLQKETSVRLRWVFILDKKGPTFDPGNPLFANQLRKGLTTNIYYNGSWGLFYQRKFTEEKFRLDSVFTEANSELTAGYFGTDLDEGLVDNNQLQVEYSGKLKDKTQVMGIGLIRNGKLFTDRILQWKVPSTWTLEDGATIPLTHSLVYYYLKIVSHIKPRESVLVTDGLSYNGQAAIAVAVALGLKVYVTVNEEKEISQVKKLYPDVNEEDILTHADEDFYLQLQSIAKNSYPHIVINNLEEENFAAAIQCVPVFGRIFHFGKKDIKKNNQIGMFYFASSISLYGASSAILDRLSASEKNEIQDFITNGIKNGFIKPLPRRVCNSEKFKNEDVSQNRIKTLFSNNAECELNRLWIDPEKSYVIIDDESNFGLNVAEWLIQRNVRNIVISSRNPPFSKKSLRNTQEQLQRQVNVIVENGCSAGGLLMTARKSAPLAAVFCIKMGDVNASKSLVELDKLYKDVQSHLILISKDDSFSELSTKRTNEGYISTNFIWKSKKELTYRDLDFMVKLTGEDSVIFVSEDKEVFDETEKTKRILLNTLPDSVQKFCDLGSSLSEEVQITELPNLGLKNSEVKELSPIFIIPGLQDDPRKTVLPLSKKLMYPAFLVKLPSKSNEFSIEKLGSLISSKIQLENKFEKSYNILGISWGSYLAMEVTRSLEKSGKNVSLMLIDVPKAPKNSKTSLEKNLIDIIQKTSNPTANDVSQQGSLFFNIDKIVKDMKLPEEKAKYYLKDGINYIFNCLQAIFTYNYSNIKLKGPLTVINSDKMDKNLSMMKMCNNILIQNLPVSQAEILTSKGLIDTIHGSAITVSMSDHTIQHCSYKELETFLIEEKIHNVKDKIYKEKLNESGAQFILPNIGFSAVSHDNIESIPL